VSLPLDLAGSTPASPADFRASTPLAVRGGQLVEGIKPFMVAKDTVGLSSYLQEAGWTEPAVISLLTCTDLTVVRAAIWALAHVGSMAANLPLAGILQHDNPATVDLAENALWSIWLRSAPLELHARLCDAIRLSEQDCLDKALEEMDWIVKSAPEYAEAFDQRAIIRFLQSDYSGAVSDYERACELNPVHFGALAGVGHCLAALGRYRDALNAYRRVQAVHPRMEGIRQAISQIRHMVEVTASRPGQIPPFRALG
jgi:tetratricopeptide (TPR) repeat protein